MGIFGKKDKEVPADVKAPEKEAQEDFKTLKDRELKSKDVGKDKEKLTGELEDINDEEKEPEEDWQSKYEELYKNFADLQKKYSERFSGQEEIPSHPSQELLRYEEEALDVANIGDLFSESEGTMDKPDKEKYKATPNTNTNTKGIVNISNTPFNPAINKASTGGFATSPGHIGTSTIKTVGINDVTTKNNASPGLFSTSPGNIGTTIDDLFTEKKEVK